MKSTLPSIPLPDPSNRWLSKQEVLALLFISNRTLQHWRTGGTTLTPVLAIRSITG